MRETTRPASVAVDCDTDIDDVVQALEHGIEVRIRRLVGDIADVQRRGRLQVLRPVGSLSSGLFRLAMVHVDAAAVPERLVRMLNGLVSSLLFRERNETESSGLLLASRIDQLRPGRRGRRGRRERSWGQSGNRYLKA